MTTIKVSGPTRDRIKLLGEQTQQTAEQVVGHALDEYERTLFWLRYAAAAERAAADPAAGAEEMSDRQLWDGTVRDGLTDA